MPLYFSLFPLTEASKSEKLTCDVSGLAIKSRLTTCKSAMWTRDGCKKGACETHWGKNNPQKRYKARNSSHGKMKPLPKLLLRVNTL